MTAGIGPPPINTASSSASAGSGGRVVQRLVELHGHQRGVAPSRTQIVVSAEGNSATSKLADIATGVVPASALRTSTCTPAT